jgi:large subunit ribosomal protein L15
MKLHELAPPAGSKHASKRVGRGIGSGHGKTACRGTKGQKSRTSIRPGFEGGQTTLYMRLRKHRGRGKGAMPQRRFKREYAVLNVASLQAIAERLGEGSAITPHLLMEKHILRKLDDGMRILGEGEVSGALTVYAHHFSKSAKAKIEAAGGRALILAAGTTQPVEETGQDSAAPQTSGGVN